VGNHFALLKNSESRMELWVGEGATRGGGGGEGGIW